MKNLKRWAVCALVWGAVACTEKKVETGSFQVIPLPQEVEEVAEAAPFVIKPSTTVCYPEGNEKLERTARFLASYIKEVSGTEVKVAAGAKGKNRIVLEVDKSIVQPEGYELHVDAGGVTLKGATEAAVFYGIQTIYKALPLTQGKAFAALPAGTVKDFRLPGFFGGCGAALFFGGLFEGNH